MWFQYHGIIPMGRRMPMKTGRPKVPVVLSEEHQQQLQSWAASRNLPHGLVTLQSVIFIAPL
jgi:hypothetical protein